VTGIAPGRLRNCSSTSAAMHGASLSIVEGRGTDAADEADYARCPRKFQEQCKITNVKSDKPRVFGLPFLVPSSSLVSQSQLATPLYGETLKRKNDPQDACQPTHAGTYSRESCSLVCTYGG
jgi:hypothetical protein